MVFDNPANTLHLSIMSTIDEVRRLGLAVRRMCRQTPLDETGTYLVELSVVEAANNIIKHAYRDKENQELNLEIHVDQDKMQLILRDNGAPMLEFSQPSCPVYDPNCIRSLPEGKMGTFLIHTIMDQVEYASENGRNVMTMTKFFADRARDEALGSSYELK